MNLYGLLRSVFQKPEAHRAAKGPLSLSDEARGEGHASMKQSAHWEKVEYVSSSDQITQYHQM